MEGRRNERCLARQGGDKEIYGKENKLKGLWEGLVKMNKCQHTSSTTIFFLTPTNESFMVVLTTLMLWVTEITLEVSKSRQSHRDVFFTVERQLEKYADMHALPLSVSIVWLFSHEELWLVALGHKDSYDITISVTLSLSHLHPLSFLWCFHHGLRWYSRVTH